MPWLISRTHIIFGFMTYADKNTLLTLLINTENLCFSSTLVVLRFFFLARLFFLTYTGWDTFVHCIFDEIEFVIRETVHLLLVVCLEWVARKNKKKFKILEFRMRISLFKADGVWHAGFCSPLMRYVVVIRETVHLSSSSFVCPESDMQKKNKKKIQNFGIPNLKISLFEAEVVFLGVFVQTSTLSCSRSQSLRLNYTLRYIISYPGSVKNSKFFRFFFEISRFEIFFNAQGSPIRLLHLG